MAEMVTYYAMYLGGRTDQDPTGLARRREDDHGLRDEALKRDLSWGHTPLIAGWKRGDMTVELIEVSTDEAERLVEQFRERWSSLQ